MGAERCAAIMASGEGMRKLYVIYILVAVIPVCLFTIAQLPLVWQWHTINQAQQQRSLIREEVLRLQWLTADIENGFRGYVLTNQTAFLHPIVTGESKMQDSIDHLMRLTQDRPNLQPRVKVLAIRIRELIETKRKLTLQIDSGKLEEVLAYIRAGEGLVLSKTIEKAVEDFGVRLTAEFSSIDREERSLKKESVQRMVVVDVVTLLIGIFVTRRVFRSAMNRPGPAMSSASIARQP